MESDKNEDTFQNGHDNPTNGGDARETSNTNGFMINGSDKSKETIASLEPAMPTLLVFSASDEGGLKRVAESYSAHLSGVDSKQYANEKEYLESLAYTLSERRSSLIWKSFATISTLSSISKEGLKLSKAVRVKSSPKLAFCFTGQGAQWFAMGRELFRYPVFLESLKEMDQYLKVLGCSWSLIGKSSLGRCGEVGIYADP